MKNEICVFCGSTMGTAEFVSEHIQDVLNKNDIKTSLHLNIDFDTLKQYKTWLLVTSTHEGGGFPNNIKSLFEDIKLNNYDLKEHNFAIAGIGNADYKTFCTAVDKAEEILLACKANQVFPSIKINVLDDDVPEVYAENWVLENLNSF